MITPKGVAAWLEPEINERRIATAHFDDDAPADEGIVWMEAGERLFLIRVTEVPS